MAAKDEFSKMFGAAWGSLPATVNLRGVDKLLMQVRELGRSSELTEEQVQETFQRLQGMDVGKIFGWRVDQADRFAQQLLTLKDALLKMADLQRQLRENKTPTGEELTPFKRINEQIEPLQRVMEIERRINEAPVEGAENIDDQTSALGKTLSATRELADAWSDVSDRIAQATVDMRTLASFPATEPQTAAAGGRAWSFLASGGRPIGMDTIPAMLSPGEFVVNAVSARRFASQLVAMNAGIKPAFRNEGGNVTNIGDINVTVSGGGSSRQTARSIAAELRRELRRGTAVL